MLYKDYLFDSINVYEFLCKYFSVIKYAYQRILLKLIGNLANVNFIKFYHLKSSPWYLTKIICVQQKGYNHYTLTHPIRSNMFLDGPDF